MPYLTRHGRIRADADRESLPYVEAPDDGAIISCFGDTALRCVDCNGVGTLAWARGPSAQDFPAAGRWLQVCQRCSAHWDPEEVSYRVLQDDSLVVDRGDGHLDLGLGPGLDVYAHLDEPVSKKSAAPAHRALVESVSAAERQRLIRAARERFRDAHNFFKGPYARVPVLRPRVTGRTDAGAKFGTHSGIPFEPAASVDSQCKSARRRGSDCRRTVPILTARYGKPRTEGYA